MPPTVFFKNYKREDPGTPPIHLFPHGVAYFSGGNWWYSGLNYGGSAAVVPVSQHDLASVKEWIKQLFGDNNPQESNYRPGTAYKRISLPLNTQGRLHKTVDEKPMNQSSVALKILLTKMEDIFETIEPDPTNLQTFGHKTRELLLLAAMETEASWAAVLKANGYAGNRFSTNDYVKLFGPMLLDAFSLKLRSYPEFPEIAPFKGWNSAAPTASLDWYNAYNQTKHNREENLNLATLHRAANAVGAAAIMYMGQFGYSFRQDVEGSSQLRRVFTLKVDHSLYPTACYIPNVGTGPSVWDWDLIDYPFPPA